MVTPERDEPGIKATICARPIRKAPFQLRVSVVTVCLPKWSASQSGTARISVAQAITSGERSASAMPEM